MSIQDAESLIGELESSDLTTRNNAVNTLAKLEHTEVVDFLIATLKRDDAHRLVKEGACKALGKIGDKRATEILLTVLDNDLENIRYQAAIALGKIADIRAVPKLIELLQRKDDQLVRSEAAKALGMIGDPSALKILLTILKKDDDRFIKYHAVTSIGQIGSKKVLKDLSKIAKSTTDDRLILRTKEAIDSIVNETKPVIAGQ